MVVNVFKPTATKSFQLLRLICRECGNWRHFLGDLAGAICDAADEMAPRGAAINTPAGFLWVATKKNRRNGDISVGSSA